MRIGGFQKLTLVDFPGLVAATVFTQGCNFRCGYCHNPELVLPQLFKAPMDPEVVFSFLSGRQGKLEGIVITGGEPTLQKGLVDFIARVKEMGFKVKIDTNGSHPEVLSLLIEQKLIDYFALDIKSSFKKYVQVTGTESNTVRVQESIDLIINSGIPYQLRTTLVKEYCTHEDLADIKRMISQANHYVLQPFARSIKMIDDRFNYQEHYTDLEMETFKAKYEKLGATQKGLKDF